LQETVRLFLFTAFFQVYKIFFDEYYAS